MRHHHWLAIYMSLLMMFILIVYLGASYQSKGNELNNQYSDYMLNATLSALTSAIQESGSENGQYIFSSDRSRTQAINAFYKTFGTPLGYNFAEPNESSDDYSTAAEVFTYELKFHIPCIMLVDTDGFYIYHVNYESGADYFICTELTKWTEEYIYGNRTDGIIYTVDYHLDDTINVKRYDIANSEITVYEGNYKDVLDILDKRGNVAGRLRDILRSEDNFHDFKTEFITGSIENNVNYYVNEMNNRYTDITETKKGITNQNAYRYDITFPYTPGQDFARFIDEPTVLAFFQGNQVDYNFAGHINLYAFAGSEVTDNLIYYIKDGYYHIAECSELSDEDRKKGYSIQEAARHGAYPDICIK